MKKFIQNKLKEQKGLTLIELLAVIVILAIIAAIAIPAIGNIIENSRYSAIKSDATNIMAAADTYFADGNSGTAATSGATPTVTVAQLKSAGFLDDAGSFSNTGTTSVSKTTTTTSATISGVAEVGNVKLTFTSATRDSINKIKRDATYPIASTQITKP